MNSTTQVRTDDTLQFSDIFNENEVLENHHNHRSTNAKLQLAGNTLFSAVLGYSLTWAYQKLRSYKEEHLTVNDYNESVKNQLRPSVDGYDVYPAAYNNFYKLQQYVERDYFESIKQVRNYMSRFKTAVRSNSKDDDFELDLQKKRELKRFKSVIRELYSTSLSNFDSAIVLGNGILKHGSHENDMTLMYGYTKKSKASLNQMIDLIIKHVNLFEVDDINTVRKQLLDSITSQNRLVTIE